MGRECDLVNEIDPLPGGWHYAAGRLSHLLSSDRLPFGKGTVVQAAKGVAMPATGVQVIDSQSLADLPSIQRFVVLPTIGDWNEREARLVSALVALGRTIGVVVSGDESVEVSRWWSAVATTLSAPATYGELPVAQMVRAGQVSQLLGLPVPSVVIEVGALPEVNPAELVDANVVIWTAIQLASNESRLVAAVRAVAAGVVVVSPSDAAPVEDAWLNDVDLIALVDGDGQWRPAGSSVTTWRTVAEVQRERKAKRDATAAARKAAEVEAQRTIEEERARVEAEAVDLRAKRDREAQADLDRSALATKKDRGEPLPLEGQPIPSDFWHDVCPWCGNAVLDLPPSGRDRPGVRCDACGKKSRRSKCSGCRATAVVRLDGPRELCDECVQVAQAKKAQTKRVQVKSAPQPPPPKPQKKRRWFSIG